MYRSPTQISSQSKQVYHTQSCFLRTLYIKSGDTRETVRSRSQNSKLTYGTSTCDLPTRCAPSASRQNPVAPPVSRLSRVCCSTALLLAVVVFLIIALRRLQAKRKPQQVTSEPLHSDFTQAHRLACSTHDPPAPCPAPSAHPLAPRRSARSMRTFS